MRLIFDSVTADKEVKEDGGDKDVEKDVYDSGSHSDDEEVGDNRVVDGRAEQEVHDNAVDTDVPYADRV